jgi:Predicted membrane protein
MRHRTPQAVPLALIALVIIGAALRIYAYAGNPSLWLDEAALANNIIGRSFAGLLAPLTRQQVAPLGFLWLERGAVELFGTSEYALRLVPLLASLAALPLFAWIARRLLTPITSIFALALFAVAIPLIYFAAETKQYSLDVMIVLALFALVLRRRAPDESGARSRATSHGQGVALTLMGAIAPWLSQPSFFVLGGVALYLMLPLIHASQAERRRGASALAPTFTVWALSGAAATVQALAEVSAADRADLDRFWEHAFLPLSSGMMASVRWLGGTTHDVFVWLFPPLVSVAAIVLFVLGIVAIARRRDGTATLLLAPIILALLASALHAYPVSYRLLLFTTPSLFLATGAGAQWLLEMARSLGGAHANARATPESRDSRAGRLGLGAAASLAVLALLALMVARSAMAMIEIPFYREELRPVVRYLAQHHEKGDAVYVYYGATPAFEYYAARYDIPRSEYRLGRCERGDWRRYLDEIDALRGRRRVWFVLSHPFAKGGIREEALFMDYFSALGSRLDSVSTIGAELRLYDLGDADARDARSTLVPPISRDSSAAAIGCVGVVAN